MMLLACWPNCKLSTAGAAMVAMSAFHRYRTDMRARPAVVSDRRGAIDYVQLQSAATGNLATLGPDLLSAAQYGLAEATQRHELAVAARKHAAVGMLRALKLQLTTATLKTGLGPGHRLGWGLVCKFHVWRTCSPRRSAGS